MADIFGAQPVKSPQDADERLQSKIVDASTPSQGMEVDSDGDAHTKAKLRDDSGNAFGTNANPIIVQATEGAGTEVHDYDQAVAVASAGSSTHTYSPANDMIVKSVHLAASSEGRYEIQFGTTGAEATAYVYFTSASNPTRVVKFDAPIQLTGGVDSIKIIKQNDDNKAQDMYSTINGVEV